MYFRILGNGIFKSKTVTLITMIFVAAAALLVSLAAVLIVNLPGALDTLMSQAKTPHFMQMHGGAIDRTRLADFAEGNNQVEDFQVLEFLNVDGAQLVIGGHSLADKIQDNGLSTQSEKFDYLLDLNGKRIQVSDGEIYAPISYMKDGTAKAGDRVVIWGKAFTVAGFLRDSQMNSPLASSKRFLVSEKDYSSLKEFGSTEYLIEFRLKELSSLGSFEASYLSAGLETNGPTVTYPLFKTMNALSDGLMIGVILLVSLLVVAVALLCIRFTLLAKIEDDYREIGVMKAIGLRLAEIRKIYLAQYGVIAAAGCVLGLMCSFLCRDRLLENIRLYMGESEHASLALMFGISGVLLVFLTILAYVNKVLKGFRNISAAEAIRFGMSQEKAPGVRKFRLSRNRVLSTNVFLGIQDVLTRTRLYATMLAVFVIASFIIIVPQNLYHTISSEDFITYMGIGKCDLRIDVQQTDHISAKAAEIVKHMAGDRDISRYAVLTTKLFKVKGPDGIEKRLKIELGDHGVFPVAYSQGRAPAAENEIALSVINAGDLGKKTGDGITLVRGGKETKLTVCGIYSDITNGGKTAKAAFAAPEADIMWSVIYAELGNRSLVGGKVSDYERRYGYAKVSDINEYIRQTFGATISSVGKASRAGTGVGLMLTLLVTLLFMKMLAAKDRYSIAVLKALGFTSRDIAAQYVSRSAVVLIAGIVLGTLLANTLGEALAGGVISWFGASSFQFTINPLWAYLMCPLMMAGSVLLGTMSGIANGGQIKLSSHIKE
ncbi:FtsX-like permease family protein [Desulfitobacterium chlororespirans]|uniref:Putative ABC transport system permease protein n=1 Tax=Desulfitobacterium chlororespirans DSM 11544 TaxID=1121395 RepID=A0A1M7SM18_9FIRM|nr:ABC transporter permease [Desulfitobacterium chlororespirans]SHN59478.1 putative ABC transport system permease protein [Desulfitobacterium chlororespirans DSM 11544]